MINLHDFSSFFKFFGDPEVSREQAYHKQSILKIRKQQSTGNFPRLLFLILHLPVRQERKTPNM